jgi:hypothetical protein
MITMMIKSEGGLRGGSKEEWNFKGAKERYFGVRLLVTVVKRGDIGRVR